MPDHPFGDLFLDDGGLHAGEQFRVAVIPLHDFLRRFIGRCDRIHHIPDARLIELDLIVPDKLRNQYTEFDTPFGAGVQLGFRSLARVFLLAQYFQLVCHQVRRHVKRVAGKQPVEDLVLDPGRDESPEFPAHVAGDIFAESGQATGGDAEQTCKTVIQGG